MQKVTQVTPIEIRRRYIGNRRGSRTADELGEAKELKSILFLCFVILLYGVVAFRPAWAECECPPDSVSQSILQAEQVFRGVIVSAEVVGDGSQMIEFTVVVDETIRGNPEAQYRLTTAMPDSCGVTIRLGFRDLFLLGSDDSRVTRCDGSGRMTSNEYPFLSLAIKLVDLPVSDARSARQLLTEELYSSFERPKMDEFFDLVEKIDPTGIKTTRAVDKIEYRGIAVLFTDGKYESVQIL